MKRYVIFTISLCLSSYQLLAVDESLKSLYTSSYDENLPEAYLGKLTEIKEVHDALLITNKGDAARLNWALAIELITLEKLYQLKEEKTISDIKKIVKDYNLEIARKQTAAYQTEIDALKEVNNRVLLKAYQKYLKQILLQNEVLTEYNIRKAFGPDQLLQLNENAFRDLFYTMDLETIQKIVTTLKGPHAATSRSVLVDLTEPIVGSKEDLIPRIIMWLEQPSQDDREKMNFIIQLIRNKRKNISQKDNRALEILEAQKTKLSPEEYIKKFYNFRVDKTYRDRLHDLSMVYVTSGKKDKKLEKLLALECALHTAFFESEEIQKACAIDTKDMQQKINIYKKEIEAIKKTSDQFFLQDYYLYLKQYLLRNTDEFNDILEEKIDEKQLPVIEKLFKFFNSTIAQDLPESQTTLITSIIAQEQFEDIFPWLEAEAKKATLDPKEKTTMITKIKTILDLLKSRHRSDIAEEIDEINQLQNKVEQIMQALLPLKKLHEYLITLHNNIMQS